MNETKQCTKCKEIKNIIEFSKDSYAKDGLRYSCKLCNSKQSRAHYHKNKILKGKFHYKSDTRLYKIWSGMKTRCYNKNRIQWSDYGGRGIKICNEWLDNFMSFYNWAINNGYRDDLTIDRIDNNKDYRPDNCRWTTKEEQVLNRRNIKKSKVKYNGITFHKGMYGARICYNYKIVYEKWFKSLSDAVNSRNKFIIDNGLPHKIEEYIDE